VFGILERGGELRAKTIKDLQGWRVRGRVLDNVKDGANLMTDEHASYQRLKGTYNVQSVNHSAGDVQSVGLEGGGVERPQPTYQRNADDEERVGIGL
jgi:ISXO2-like transposase domain